MSTEGFCRGCLIKFDDLTDLIQYTEKNRRLFVYSTGIQVKRNDMFTFQLCKDCYLNMKVSCKFKKLCRSSEKRFKNFLGIKETGENIDFCSFLKNNDDSWMFRFPMNGNSTPAIHKNKDDDNDSTCTSIRNFMTDILPSEEIPDTEARIIREVIEEEADVLDDSLDSHWLQDDASIDTDFRLDFSFSPFSTPKHSTDHNNVKTQKVYENYFSNKNSKSFKKSPFGQLDCKIRNHEYSQEKLEEISKEIEDYHKDDIEDNKFNKLRFLEDYITNHDSDSLPDLSDDERNRNLDELDCIEFQNNNDDDKLSCTIDRNLEVALKNESHAVFSLDDLLVSPQPTTVQCGPPTPEIKNILFGDKLDCDDEGSDLLKEGRCIQTFEGVQGDIDLDEFFNKNSQDSIDLKNDETNIDNIFEKVFDSKVTEDKLEESEDLFNITNFYCKSCEKTFSSIKNLRIHATKYHKMTIAKNKDRETRRTRLCPTCGKGFSHRYNYFRHLKTHQKKSPRQVLHCSICSIKYGSEATLKMHMKTHSEDKVVEKKKEYVCTTCGATSSSASNHRIHMRRHTNTYTCYCNECSLGFYRKTDLIIHFRKHTGERPYSCSVCAKCFSRKDMLNHHMKSHTGERAYSCEYCSSRFKKKSNLNYHLLTSKTCMNLRMNGVPQVKAITPASQPQNKVVYAYIVNIVGQSDKIQPNPT